jgi:hypothetical protein
MVTSFHALIVKPAVTRTELVSSYVNKKLVSLFSAYGTGKCSSRLASVAGTSKKGKLATGPQHAPDLTVNSLSVWNIHDDMLGPHHVEMAVRKR